MPELRAGLYLRVSTADQHAANQLPDLERRAAFERATRCESYVDAGVSGALASRPELDRLLADARAGRLDLVICWSVSRFGRNMVASVLAMDELLRLGVRLVFVKESIDTSTVVGRAVAALLSGLAEQDLDERRARVRNGLARVKATRVNGQRGTERTRTGRPLGRPRANVSRDGAVLWTPETALELLAQGLSARAVAAQLGTSRRTIQRLKRGAQNPPASPAVQIPENPCSESST